MNAKRRKKFLVKLKGLSKSSDFQTTCAADYKQTEWEKDQFKKTIDSWNVWLKSGRLVNYYEDDFPDLTQSENEKVPNLISQFEGFAGQYSELSQDEINQARDTLASLIEIFWTQLSNTHGEPRE